MSMNLGLIPNRCDICGKLFYYPFIQHVCDDCELDPEKLKEYSNKRREELKKNPPKEIFK